MFSFILWAFFGVFMNSLTCHDCSAPFNKGDKFCAKCGRSFFSSKSSGEKRRSSRPSANPDAAEQCKQLRSAKVRRGFAWFFGGLFLAAGVLLMGPLFIKSATIPAIVVAVVFTLVGLFLGMFRESDYYSVPGTRAEDGGHLCVFCGGRGIHRSTRYKTNTVDAVCSKCRTHLWVE